VLLVLNLTERHYQQQRAAGEFVSASSIHDTVSLIRTISTLTLILDGVWLILVIVWSNKRRTRARLAMGGEASVESQLRLIARPLYIAGLAAALLSLLVTQAASSAARHATTANDFVHYRTDLAWSHALRIFMWITYALVVIKSTRFQDRREAMGVPAPPPPPSHAPAPAPFTPPPVWQPPPQT
jgi:hypothetical protein